jgi:hypothetical protein
VLIQDFNNLLSVYLDAVFCPLLRELDFLQEGWRLENEELDDKNSPFIIKGKATPDTNGSLLSFAFCKCKQRGSFRNLKRKGTVRYLRLDSASIRVKIFLSVQRIRK